ncbi:probable BOI-related E3 ubiquitin-protein ligase 2 [Coffea eugenioides]|uniref:probable BOI-related E3 ubiquitin-protein ligase 2 n=1 Tax=Coffea eugenioides TaxID=49369 RepID=UPI000F60CF12|nr:probable BOI-related E3 ubiquitin-protein ligase 2 [Coffea eugenioides]
MAVDASHLNLLPPQLMNPNRDFAFSNQGNTNTLAYNNVHQMGTGSGVPLIPAIAEGLLPLHHPTLACDSVQPKTSMNTDSGLTYNMPAPRKRPRDSFDQFNNVPANFFVTSQQKNNSNDVVAQFPSFFGEQILPFINQHQLDIDSIISQHTKKIRLELEERQKQHARILMAAIGEGVVKKMKEKDEQIQRMGKLNLALQERVKSLYVENQLWRDLAQTNEATANSLRTNLEQVLAHVSDERLSAVGRGGGAGVAVEDDAESCCGSSDHGNEREAEEETSAERRILAGGMCGRIAVEAQDKEANVSSNKNNNNNSRMCKMCGERESCVLLLPCRHLCLCTVCGSTLLHTCPACNSNMNATVHVNLSS